jgi:hypothetical protein
MRTVSIEVMNERLGERMSQGFGFPVNIGRGSDCHIQLDPENRAISRLHVVLTDNGTDILLDNRASNANVTSVGGRPLRPGEKARLAIGDSFRIFDYDLKIMEPASIAILFASKKDLRPRAEHLLLPGRALLAYEEGNRLLVEPVPNLERLDASRFANRMAVLFYYDGENPTFAMLGDPQTRQVLLDRGIVQQQALYIQALDTIEIGDHRFEIHAVGEPAILCENVSCQVLNAYDRGENCRLCGTRLFGDTRIVRGGRPE